MFKLFKKKPTNNITGSIIPVVRCIKYSPNIKPKTLKQTLIRNMAEELAQYTTFTEEEQENGSILLTARLDVLSKDPILEGEKKC